MKDQNLPAEYCAALRAFLAADDPHALDAARDLGRRALSGAGAIPTELTPAALLADHLPTRNCGSAASLLSSSR